MISWGIDHSRHCLYSAILFYTWRWGGGGEQYGYKIECLVQQFLVYLKLSFLHVDIMFEKDSMGKWQPCSMFIKLLVTFHCFICSKEASS